MHISEELLKKYNVAVPRYTSYPPANHFSEVITAETHASLLRASNAWEPNHIALYVHIPFCRKICFYCGCNACTVKSAEQTDAYLEALSREISTVAAHIDRSRKVTQVHFGGGTPNVLPAQSLRSILLQLRSDFSFVASPEIAIELNPACLDDAYLDALLKSGFNRFSLGVQDFNTDVLKNVNRDPSAIPLERIRDRIMASGSGTALNLDLIYGLPGQDAASFSASIDKAIEIGPDRLVTFAYAHVPWLKKHQVILEKKGLPGPGERTAMYMVAYEKMINAGYHPVGLDHFVRTGDKLHRALQDKQLHRNFQGYCTRETTGQVYAFGNSAISQLDRAYLQNVKDADQYTARIMSGQPAVEKGLELTTAQVLTREVITRIMCNRSISWDETAAFLGTPKEQILDITGYDIDGLTELQRDGILEFSDEGLQVTEKGSMFIRNVAALFDPAYERQEMKYSRSV